MDECGIPQEVASLLSGPSLFLGLTDGYRATSSASRRSSFGSRNTCALIRLPTPPYSCMYLYLYPYSYLQLPNLWLCWNVDTRAVVPIGGPPYAEDQRRRQGHPERYLSYHSHTDRHRYKYQYIYRCRCLYGQDEEIMLTLAAWRACRGKHFYKKLVYYATDLVYGKKERCRDSVLRPYRVR